MRQNTITDSESFEESYFKEIYESAAENIKSDQNEIDRLYKKIEELSKDRDYYAQVIKTLEKYVPEFCFEKFDMVTLDDEKRCFK